MNDLLLTLTHHYLANALAQDGLTALALLSTWLDPVSIDDEIEEDDPLMMGLLIARRCFPDVYVAAISHLHRGCTASQLEDVLVEGITKAGIPLDEGGLEMIMWGIPLPAYGCNLLGDDFFEQHPQTIPLLRLFGFTFADDESTCDDIPDLEIACDLAIVLHQSLALTIEQNECHRQFYHALGWLWSISSNSSVDMDYESLCEYPPLEWTQENIDFAILLITEAENILSDAMAGLDYLQAHPATLDLIAQHLKTIRKYYQRKFKKGDQTTYDQLSQLAHRLKLDWSALA